MSRWEFQSRVNLVMQIFIPSERIFVAASDELTFRPVYSGGGGGGGRGAGGIGVWKSADPCNFSSNPSIRRYFRSTPDPHYFKSFHSINLLHRVYVFFLLQYFDFTVSFLPLPMFKKITLQHYVKNLHS